jgi:hypothetical protein
MCELAMHKSDGMKASEVMMATAKRQTIITANFIFDFLNLTTSMRHGNRLIDHPFLIARTFCCFR